MGRSNFGKGKSREDGACIVVVVAGKEEGDEFLLKAQYFGSDETNSYFVRSVDHYANCRLTEEALNKVKNGVGHMLERGVSLEYIFTLYTPDGRDVDCVFDLRAADLLRGHILTNIPVDELIVRAVAERSTRFY